MRTKMEGRVCGWEGGWLWISHSWAGYVIRGPRLCGSTSGGGGAADVLEGWAMSDVGRLEGWWCWGRGGCWFPMVTECAGGGGGGYWSEGMSLSASALADCTGEGA